MSKKSWAALAFVLVAAAALLTLMLRREPEASDRAHQATGKGTSARVASGGADRAAARRARPARPRPAAAETRTTSAVAGSPSPASPSPVRTATLPSRTEQLATTVLAAAVRHDWVVTDEHDAPCPPERIRVVYDAPSDLSGYTKGAYFEPLGPGPNDRTDEVNGLLLCEGSAFQYRGFEAYYRADRGQWDVYPFPVIE